MNRRTPRGIRAEVLKSFLENKEKLIQDMGARFPDLNLSQAESERNWYRVCHFSARLRDEQNPWSGWQAEDGDKMPRRIHHIFAYECRPLADFLRAYVVTHKGAVKSIVIEAE